MIKDVKGYLEKRQKRLSLYHELLKISRRQSELSHDDYEGMMEGLFAERENVLRRIHIIDEEVDKYSQDLIDDIDTKMIGGIEGEEKKVLQDIIETDKMTATRIKLGMDEIREGLDSLRIKRKGLRGYYFKIPKMPRFIDREE